MGRRFGGRFSPGTDAAPAARRAGPKPGAGGRARLMFVAPLPLPFTGFAAIVAGDVGAVVARFSAFALLILAAWLLREGLRAEAAYRARSRARPPALPRKALAALLTGGGVFLAAWPAGSGGGGALGLVVALLAVLLQLFAFGLDPMRGKGLAGLESMSGRRVARAVARAEQRLDEMIAAAAGLNEPALERRVAAFADSARAMFRQIEDDPRDLAAARRYLSVYLSGARDATRRFAGLYGRRRDPALRADFEALLADLQQNFEAARGQMLLDDRSAFDVEIEVLRERLRREGVKG